MKLTVNPVPAFNDNYIWVIEKQGSNQVTVVDPGDANAVLNWLQQKNATLTNILITHKHHDHIGGVKKLVETTQAKVYAPKELSLIEADNRLSDADGFNLLGVQWRVIAIPGHTLEHIMYHCPEESLAFVGDTLFAGGCGRIFEGTAEQMHRSLSRIMSLPEETAVYPAHEYTLANLRFALEHEPDNNKLQQRYVQAQAMRAKGQPTLPTSIAEEKATNPFCRPKQLRNRAEQQSGLTLNQDWQVFAWLRHAKDMA